MNPVEYTGREQRITFQLYNYWFGLADDYGIPPLKSLTPADIAAYKNNMVLIDLRDTDNEPTLQVIGQLLKQDLDEDLNPKGISDIPRRTLLSRITDHYMEVLGNKSPISFDAEFLNKAREKILYRGILLPFSDDGTHINFILGAIRWISEEEALAKKTPAKKDATKEKPSEEAEEKSQKEAPKESDEPESEPKDKPEDKPKKKKAPAKKPLLDQKDTTDGDLLQEHLAHCRTLVQGQNPADQRSRRSLYEALGAILDFHELCLVCADNYSALLTAEGLKSQKRAPYTPTLKLCFGRDYDKTRLTEYAAALSFAQKNNQNGKSLPDFLEQFPGGIKGCVREEREGREDPADLSIEDSKKTIDTLPPLATFDIPQDIENNLTADEDFCLLLARRDGKKMTVIKILEEHEDIMEPLLKRVAKDP